MRKKSRDFSAHCFIWNRSCSHHDSLMTFARKEVSVIAISIFKTRLLPDPSLCQKRSNE